MRISHLWAAAALLLIPGCSGSWVTLDIYPYSTNLKPGGTQQFIVKIPRVSHPEIEWSIQEGTSGGSITSDGVYTAPTSAGTYHVVAKGGAYHNGVGTATIEVKP